MITVNSCKSLKMLNSFKFAQSSIKNSFNYDLKLLNIESVFSFNFLFILLINLHQFFIQFFHVKHIFIGFSLLCVCDNFNRIKSKFHQNSNLNLNPNSNFVFSKYYFSRMFIEDSFTKNVRFRFQCQ